MLIESGIIAPHGGHLVDRRAPEEERSELVRGALGLPRVHLDARTLSDLQMIASGVFSPLEGFMLREDYESVVEEMRLSSGLAWSMPITLAAEEDTARSLREDSLVTLVDDGGEPVATMYLRERYTWAERPLPPEQLYDLLHDPNEAHNLAGEPALESVLEDMRARLDAWMHETKDPLLDGPVPAPSGAELNGRDQLSAADPTTVV